MFALLSAKIARSRSCLQLAWRSASAAEASDRYGDVRVYAYEYFFHFSTSDGSMDKRRNERTDSTLQLLLSFEVGLSRSTVVYQS